MTRIVRFRAITTVLALATLLVACSSGGTSSALEPSPTTPSTPAVVDDAVPSQSDTIDEQFVDTIDSSRIEGRGDDLNADGYFDDVRVSAEGTRHLIPLDAIEWGGVARDGIPSLDRPAYVGPERWDQMTYDPDGLVIGVEVNGNYRAYPLQILIWHEIVNETFDGKHLLVTY